MWPAPAAFQPNPSHKQPVREAKEPRTRDDALVHGNQPSQILVKPHVRVKQNRDNQDLVMTPKRRGGRDKDMISHGEWLNSVQAEPDVISMSFIPITSLLNGVPGSGFLNDAINLYLRYKPPIEELHQFLEFQLPRQWAPVYSDLPLGPQRKRQSSASLPVTFIGPKLYVRTNMVDVGKRPITGLQLFLEGKKSNKLAIHLQHLCSLPQISQLEDDPYNNQSPEAYDLTTLESATRALELLCLGLITNATLSSIWSMEPEPTQMWPQAMSSLMQQEFFMRRGVLSTLRSSCGSCKITEASSVRPPMGRRLSMVMGMLLCLPIFVLGSDITGLEQTGSQNTSEFLLPIIQAVASVGPSNDEGEMSRKAQEQRLEVLDVRYRFEHLPFPTKR
ncbi:hypothetical protein ACQ4PT_037418 [Festuca glaucescens]